MQLHCFMCVIHKLEQLEEKVVHFAEFDQFENQESVSISDLDLNKRSE